MNGYPEIIEIERYSPFIGRIHLIINQLPQDVKNKGGLPLAAPFGTHVRYNSSVVSCLK